MEKHRCKLCHRNFANGRALGGHMRSHVMLNLYASSKQPKRGFLEEEMFLSEEEEEEIESVPSSSSSSEDEDEDEDEEEEEDNGGKGLFSPYGMSSNHRKSKKRGGFGTADSDQHCFGAAAEAAGSVVLQDRESETESSKNPIRRRSRRVRKSRISDGIQFSDYHHHHSIIKESPKEKKPNSEKQGTVNPSTEAEPVSSISDTTPEEHVAHCLMMLSRDKWEEEEEQEQEQEENFYEEEEEEKATREDTKSKQHYCHDFDVVKASKSSRSRGKYRCETCNKVFRSYQALGGHRASHKRIKLHNNNTSDSSTKGGGTTKERQNGTAANNAAEEKIHECPVCYRVFSSGQALGGHKRSHVMGSAAIHQIVNVSTVTALPPAPRASSRIGESFIDLNLPAPVDDDEDDDDVSQIELSAVSDAEFVNNPFKHH